MSELFLRNSALFSDDRIYRYELWRIWDDSKPYAMFIGLNPSTADEVKNDPTVRRCIRFSMDWGYGALCMTNIFAYRATDPRVMKRADEPVGPENDSTLVKIASGAGIIIGAWGNHGSYMDRDRRVLDILPEIHHLGLTMRGKPKHPLYLPSNTVPEKMEYT